MAKPHSLAAGNTLILISARFGRKEVGQSTWQWRDSTNHQKLIGVPRLIVAARSKYVEVGAEKSILNYPKMGQFVETPETIKITYVDDGIGTCADNATELTYTVSKP